jgi:GT2 family glycosyltransferase
MAAPDDVTAVVVALSRSPRLTACLHNLLDGGELRADRVVCVIVDPDAAPASDDQPGVRYLYPGMNLGWPGALHYARSRVQTPLMWLLQDDVTVGPGALAKLLASLNADPSVGAVRPVVIGDDGLIGAGACGARLDSRGNQALRVPPNPVKPEDFDDADDAEYLLSSAMLVRIQAWDEVGGTNPWYFPVSFVDVDLSLALRSAGWRLRHVRAAQIHHPARASTPSLLGAFTFARNHLLLRAGWFPDAPPAPDEIEAYLPETHVSEALRFRRGRGSCADADLREIAGTVAADSYVRFARYAQRAFDDTLTAYEATVEARDWWRAQHEKATGDYDRALRERDDWRARSIGSSPPA